MTANSQKLLERIARRHHASLQRFWLPVEGGELTVAVFDPAGISAANPTVVVAPGWASTPATWRYFLGPLLRDFRCVYFESREKTTARLNRGATHSISTQTVDLLETLAKYGGGNAILVGASTGANLSLEAVARDSECCREVFLLAPHRRVPLPAYLPRLAKLPMPLAATAKTCARVALRVRGPASLEDQQYHGLVTAVDAANLKRLGASASAWRDYSLADATAESITVRATIIVSRSDSFHSSRSALEIAAAIPQSSIEEVSDFSELHSSRTGARVGALISSVTKAGAR